jgi:hypothetical protein
VCKHLKTHILFTLLLKVTPFTMAAEEEEGVEWKISSTKELLLRDLLDGTIPMTKLEGMTIQQAFDSRPEYQSSLRRLWAGRLRSARKQMLCKKSRSEFDKGAYDHDITIRPKKTHNHRGEPRWDGGETQWYLRDDMAANIPCETIKEVKVLYDSREAYKRYPIWVFRNKVHQEVRRIKRKNENDKKSNKLIDEGDDDDDDDYDEDEDDLDDLDLT